MACYIIACVFIELIIEELESDLYYPGFYVRVLYAYMYPYCRGIMPSRGIIIAAVREPGTSSITNGTAWAPPSSFFSAGQFF